MKKFYPSITVVVLLLIIWQAGVRVGHVDPELLPAPSVIWTSLVNNWNVLLGHTAQTILETLIGIFAGIILGVGIAIAFDASPIARRALRPLLIVSQTIPMIALAPLLLIWIGFGIMPKIIVVTLFCFFPIAIAASDGLAKVDPELLKLFASMNASYLQKLRLVKIPSSMPSFFSGLKIAVTYSMTGAMVGEYVGAYKGLGVFIQTAANAHQMPLVFATIFITAIISIILFGAVCLIEKITTPWQNA